MNEQQQIEATQRYLDRKRGILEDIQSREKGKDERRQRDIRDLRRMPYVAYLRTVHWQQVREDALARAGFRCQKCRRGDRTLDVHHINYDNRGDEAPEDLVVLCRGCHFGTPHPHRKA